MADDPEVELSSRCAYGTAAVGAMDLIHLVRGCTFDDFLLVPQLGVVPSRDPARIDLTARFTRGITLRRPLVSANMDTITRASMAIVLAEEGGIGVIDRGFRAGDIGPQVAEISAVKRTQHGIVADPHTIGEPARIFEARHLMARTGVGTLVVVDGARRIRGLLTERDVRFVQGGATVADRMTPREQLVMHEGTISLADAERIMTERKIKKLPLVAADGTVLGLITAKDLLKHREHPFATRDDHGRLRVAAAVGATGDFLERAVEVQRAGADAVVIDIAHGHSTVMERAIEQLRQRLGAVDLIAGNVATADGARFLLDRGADAIKVGIGPGAGCTTRSATNFGVPQVEALVQCRRAIADRVPLIADGGLRRDGSLVEALLFGGDTVMLGSAFAGTEETPGEIVLKAVLMPESQKIVRVPFKVFRGMASIGAVRDRLDLEDAAPGELETLGAEGLEVSVPARGSARTIIHDMLKHLCSSVSYGGAESLGDLRERFWSEPGRYLIRLSEASRRESFER
ncbi:MAG: CBS domain-containing protein [Luteitalea sp.]|nr:CBS domain-containing protein [Luteitalea sp.]